MLERGVFLAPSQFEAAFVSLAHSDDDVDAAGRAAAEAFGPSAERRARSRARIACETGR